MTSISTTSNVLLPFIEELSTDQKGIKGVLKSEVLTRVCSFSVIFFRTFDAVSNFGAAIGCSIGRGLKQLGFKCIRQESVSTIKIKNYFQGAKNSVTKDSLLLFQLLRSPKILSKMYSKKLDSNWGLDQHFKHIYVINLDDNPNDKQTNRFQHRLELLRANLKEIGINKFERLRATLGSKELSPDVWNRVKDFDDGLGLTGTALQKAHMRQAGCFHSHYRCVKDAYEKHEQGLKNLTEGREKLKKAATNTEKDEALRMIKAAEAQIDEYSSVLILEDDNGFGFLKKENDNAPFKESLEGTGAYFKKVMNELPADWDMFYFMAIERGVNGERWLSARSPTVTENLRQLQHGILNNAYAVNAKAYPILLSSLKKIDDPKARFYPLDDEIGSIHTKMKAYIPAVPLAYQRGGESSITEGSLSEPWNGSSGRGF